MISIDDFRKEVLSLQGTEENPHFDRAAFKVIAKRIFATLHEPSQSANLKLSVVDQSVFSDYKEGIYPVANKWGLQGWTTFELRLVPKELFVDALNCAYEEAKKGSKRSK